MHNDRAKEALKAYYRNIIKKFDESINDPTQDAEMFTASGFTYVEEDCDGFCPECEHMLKCETYQEKKEEWRLFYS